MLSQLLIVTALGLTLAAGNCDPETPDAGSGSDAASGSDSSTGSDSSSGSDSSTGSDGSTGSDAASGNDSGTASDAASGSDAGSGGLTVYDIQDVTRPGHPAPESTVTLEGVIVTAVDTRPSTTGFWVQEPGGGPYSGIFVYAWDDNTYLPLNTLNRGDIVTVTGTYKEYYDLSEISATGGSVTGQTTVPSPATPTGIDTDAEQWEGVLVRFNGPCNVTTVRSQYGIVETSCFLLDDDVYEYSLSEGQQLSHITGLIHYGFDEYKVLPRDPADLGGASSSDGGVSGDGGGGNCGALTYQGECQSDTVRYCYLGTVIEENCVTEYGSDATCGLLDCTGSDCQGYYCVAKPSTSCAELDCDLSHGCRGGVCTSSDACDSNYTDSCSSATLTYCHPHSDLVNELVCNTAGSTSIPYTCGNNSSGTAACLGTEGSENCDLSSTPPAECAAGLVCSSSSGVGDCQPATDAGVVEDGGAASDAASSEDGPAAVDAGVEDSAVDAGVVSDSGPEDTTPEDL